MDGLSLSTKGIIAGIGQIVYVPIIVLELSATLVVIDKYAATLIILDEYVATLEN